MKIMTYPRLGIALLATLCVAPLLRSFSSSSPVPPVITTTPLSQLLPPLTTPTTTILTGLLSLLGKPRDLKLLVLSADGTDPAFSAVRAVLDQIGTPYDAVVLTQTHGALPPLENSTKGFYQGIILSTGNLATCTTNPCSIALPAAGWSTLDKYAAQYGVRTLSYYSFPDPRYGIAWNGTAALGGTASFLQGSAPVFQNVNRSGSLPVRNAYYYGAVAAPAAGDTTTPILAIDGQAAAFLHRKADGREYLALTFDNNPYLLHSVVLGFDLVSWVSKGTLLGERRAYLSPQIDDIFLNSDLYSSAPGCHPPGFQLDPTVDPTGGCNLLRMTGGDLNSLVNWQNQVNSRYAAGLKLTMAFNGFGTTAAGGAAANDDLTAAAINTRNQFFWISHTYDHENLDCYNPVPNSYVCTPATYSQSIAEIDNNSAVGRKLGLSQDSTSMVTPNVSGLNNPNFISAAVSRGIRYMVMDASILPAGITHNTGIVNPYNASVLEVPRRPTNIFYNTWTPYLGVPGSQTDEYNYFYGPDGISRVGGPGGPPFFTTVQSYNDLLNREAEFIVLNMLRGEVYPLMFHQANLSRYNGSDSLLTDLMNATMAEFSQYATIPAKSLSLTDIAGAVRGRMSYNASGVSATLTPGVSLTIQVSRTATIPVTGLCRLSCQSNGAQPVSYYTVTPLLPAVVLLP